VSAAVCLIFTSSALFVSKKQYGDWRDAQEEFADYKASLGPWAADEAAEYLAIEYRNLPIPASTQIEDFIRSTDLIREIRIG
jgi:hypothetical protein